MMNMTVFVDGIYSKECSLNTSALAKLLNENRQKGEQARNVDIYRNVRMECTQKNEKDRLYSILTLDEDKDFELTETCASDNGEFFITMKPNTVIAIR